MDLCASIPSMAWMLYHVISEQQFIRIRAGKRQSPVPQGNRHILNLTDKFGRLTEKMRNLVKQIITENPGF